MRVLLVNKFADASGGADVHVVTLREGLESAGHAAMILTTGDRPSKQDRIITIAAPVRHASRDVITGRARARAAAAGVWNRTAWRESCAMMQRFAPDVIHTHKLYPQLSVAPVVAAKSRRLPIVQTLHDYELLSASALDPYGRLYDRDETALAYRAFNTALFPIKRIVHRHLVDAFVAVSRRVADLYAAHGVYAHVLPNFTVQTVVRRGRGTYVAFVGRLVREKGVDDVLRLACGNPQLPVVVAGDGPERASVAAAASALPNLTYVGRLRVSEVPSMLQGARLLVMPSHWEEPGPMTLLQAFAVGTPVVTYDLGGAAEYVRDSGGGVVTTPAELGNAVNRVFHDKELFESLSANATRAARTDHQLSAYVERLVDIYERALHNRRAALTTPRRDCYRLPPRG